MATNPPITIGPFANVPAPGSGVKSDWAQQITNYVLRGAWTPVTVFTNGWSNFAGFQVARYRKEGDRVFVEGLVKGGTVNTVAFTLPAGFRPPAAVVAPSAAAGIFATITIDSLGAVTLSVPNNTNVTLLFTFSTT